MVWTRRVGHKRGRRARGRRGAGPLQGPRRGGQRSLEDAVVLELVGNSERGGGRRCRRGVL